MALTYSMIRKVRGPSGPRTAGRGPFFDRGGRKRSSPDLECLFVPKASVL